MWILWCMTEEDYTMDNKWVKKKRSEQKLVTWIWMDQATCFIKVELRVLMEEIMCGKGQSTVTESGVPAFLQWPSRQCLWVPWHILVCFLVSTFILSLGNKIYKGCEQKKQNRDLWDHVLFNMLDDPSCWANILLANCKQGVDHSASCLEVPQKIWTNLFCIIIGPLCMAAWHSYSCCHSIAVATSNIYRIIVQRKRDNSTKKKNSVWDFSADTYY